MKQLILALSLLILLACSSCVVDPETIAVWGGDVYVPELTTVHTVSAKEVVVGFTAPVCVSAAVVQCFDDPDRVITAHWNEDENSEHIVFVLSENPGVGVSAVLHATVTDEKRNTLSFSVVFIGYNERVPELIINEVRTSYSKPRVEFIELLILSDGNLAGVQIENSMNSKESYYEFPSCEVRAGDYVLLHFRSIEEGLVNETDRIDESSGTDSSPFAWDFWDTQDRAPLKSTNVLLIRDRSGGTILDALLCAESEHADWPTEALRIAAEIAVSEGAWGPTALVSDAACSDYMTATRTLGRIPESDDTDSASDWMVCATSNASPGAENSTKPHVAK